MGFGIEGILALLVPYVLFISIAVTICVYFYFRNRTNTEIQKTVRAAIEQGQQLNPESLSHLVATPRSAEADLRRGVMAIAIGIGIGVFGILVGEADARQPLLAIGALPFLIGLAYLGLWAFSSRTK